MTLVWLVANDSTGVGVTDDGFIPVVTTSFLAFWTILFNKGDDNKW